jgi:hypothetical protein
MIPLRQKLGLLQTKKQACTVMHLFPMFPPEIQLKIWRYTFPGPRVVSIRYDNDDRAYSSSATPPVALFICKQSREEAKRFWQLTFGSKIDEGRVWVSFDIDQVLFMTGGGFGDNGHPALYSLLDLEQFVLKTKGVEKIKLLALYSILGDTVETARFGPSNRLWIEEVLFPAMRNLERVWQVFSVTNSNFLEDGASGFIVSKKKLLKTPCDDLSLVPDVWRPCYDVWFLVPDLTAEQEQDTAQNVRGHKAMQRVVVWSDVVFRYRDLTMILVLEDFEPGGIRPVVQLDRKRGLQDPTILKVTDAELIKRPFSLGMYLRGWK